jgi:uncharacterized sporulation protein YeaH/YhbH (DUF444 family)
MKQQLQHRSENQITKVLYNQVSLVVAVGAVLLALFNFVNTPQADLERKLILLEAQVSENRALAQQLANIKDNDLHQIVSNQGEIKQQIQELRDIVIELRTIVRR